MIKTEISKSLIDPEMIKKLDELAEKKGGRREWSAEEDAIIVHYYTKISRSALRKILRCSNDTLNNRYKELVRDDIDTSN